MKICRENHEYSDDLKRCPTCRKVSSKLWQVENRDKRKVYKATWHLNHKLEENTRSSEYREVHKEDIKKYLRSWRSDNRGRANASQRQYEATKLQATPPWLAESQLQEIADMYVLAQDLAWLNQDGQIFHVDHIVPPQGTNCSGLHVPWNLQLLPAKDNLKKSNKIVE